MRDRLNKWVTSYGWSDERRNALKHQQNSKSVCQFIQAQQVHQNHRRQTNVCANRGSENDRVQG